MKAAADLVLTAARHGLWAQRDRVRDLIWRERLGYQPRFPPQNRIDLVQHERAQAPPAATPESGEFGVLENGTALAECGQFLGLSVVEPDRRGAVGVLNDAVQKGWPLLGCSAATLTQLPEAGWNALSAFLAGGGTLFVAGVAPAPTPVLAEFGRRLRMEPLCAEPGSGQSTAVLFPGDKAGFAHELAGVRVETSVQGARLRGEGMRVLAFSVVDGGREPSVVEQGVAPGRIIFSGFPAVLPSRLAGCFGPEHAPLFLPPMMLLRQLYGVAAWHPPALLANFTIDDPALRQGLLGLPYSEALRRGRDHGFHVTVATIPAELGLADPAVIAQLAEGGETISACYHGWDHNGYEFYRSEGRRLRYRVRALSEQRADLRRAVEHGLRFARRTGYELDRVMVFPHGLGPAALLPDLHNLGFIGSCNLDNRYPLEAPVPDDPYLGLRPADTAWAGFPLLWRRDLADRSFPLDLFIGRPALTFEHRRALGEDFLPFVLRAEEIRRLAPGRVVWRSLDEVTRHTYLQRRDLQRGWQVLMASNEACLHNPDPTPRTYSVWRPHVPAGSTLEVCGAPASRLQPLDVTVPAGGTAVIRLVPTGDDHRLGPRMSCSIFPVGAVASESPSSNANLPVSAAK